MKKKLLLLFLVAISSASLFGQRNYGQELCDLLARNKCFEAYDFRRQYNDSLLASGNESPSWNFVEVFYNYRMAQFFNKPDSAAIYLDSLVTNYKSILGSEINGFLGNLARIYIENEQYEKALAICDKVELGLKLNLGGFEDSFVNSELNEIANFRLATKQEAMKPRRRIVWKNPNKDVVLKIKTDQIIQFPAKYNGINLNTWFDTGVTGYFFVERATADKIGIKRVGAENDTLKIINGVEMNVMEGLVDSISIGDIQLYNIPALIFANKLTSNMPDSLMSKPDIKARIDSGFSDFQIIMGLPMMKMIGRIELDWKNKLMTLSPRVKASDGKAPNIYTMDNYLYSRLRINNLDFAGLVDTGAECFLDVDSIFYDKNRSAIQLDLSANKETLNYYSVGRPQVNIAYQVIKDPQIKYNDLTIPANKLDVLVLSKNFLFMNRVDGVIGYDFFRRIGKKTILDFNRMRIDSK